MGRRPLVRVRHAPSHRAAHWAFSRIERWASPLLVGLVIFVLGLPEDLFESDAYLAPLLFGFSIAGLFELARRFNVLSAAALLVLFGAAFALGTGDASVRGVQIFGVYASPGSVGMALLSVVLFQFVLVVGSGAFSRAAAKLVPRSRAFVERDVLRRVVAIGLGILIAVSFTLAAASGTWTYYGADGMTSANSGNFRAEFLAEPAMLAGIALVVDEILRVTEQQGTRKRLVLLITIGLVLAGLLFMRQIRRVMLMALVTTLLQISWHPIAARRWLNSPRRLVPVLLIFGLIVASLHYGSVAWRQSARQFATNDLAKRVEDAVSRVGDIDDEVVLKNTKSRLNYLWLESASIEHQPMLGRVLSLPDLFMRSVYYALPGSLVPGKYRHELYTCETAFLVLGVDTDLACTPSSEAYISSGLLGVIIVALTWVPIVGLACVLMRRRSALGIIIAMHLLNPLCVIETSAFPIVSSVRVALIGLGALTISSLLGVLFFGWGILGPQRATRPRTVRA